MLHYCAVADMLSQYVEVEQLGPIYVCDACNGMSESLSSLTQLLVTSLVCGICSCLERCVNLFVCSVLHYVV